MVLSAPLYTATTYTYEIKPSDGVVLVGNIIWKNRDVGNHSDQIEVYKGDLIMTSSGKGTIECLDSRTGLIKWKSKAPNNCIDDRASFGLYSFVINPKTNLLYICDNFFIQCLKLPGYE